MKLRVGTELKNVSHNQTLVITDIYLTPTQASDNLVVRIVVRTEDGVCSSTPVEVFNKRISSGAWIVI